MMFAAWTLSVISDQRMFEPNQWLKQLPKRHKTIDTARFGIGDIVHKGSEYYERVQKGSYHDLIKSPISNRLLRLGKASANLSGYSKAQDKGRVTSRRTSVLTVRSAVVATSSDRTRMKDRIPTPLKPAKPPERGHRRECEKVSSSRARSVNRKWCSMPSMSVWIISAFLLSCISSTRAQVATNGTDRYNITALPSLITLVGSNTSNSSTTTVTVPSSEADLTYVTINLCSLASSNGTYSPSIWLTNSSSISTLGISTVLDSIGNSKPGVLWQKDRSTGMVQDGRYNHMIAVNEDNVHQVLDGTSDGIQQQVGKTGNAMIWNLQTWKGYGNWTGIGVEGVWLEVDSMVKGLDMEIGVDTDGPIHTISPLLPMFGDTTATQSLILSPILASTNISQPTYPNYRISSPYPINATVPSNLTTMRVVIVPTSESPDTASDANLSLGNSMCAVMRAEHRTGSLADNSASNTDGDKTKLSLEQRPEGWRWGFVTGTLSAETNYTAWTIEEGTGTGKTANMTYAYHGKDKEDKGHGEGEDDGGIDEWGNRWCNGGLPG
ncbi:hypothetical protein QFC19_006498 [Naganishia cerealis]|uniref:Uncharacterized protein n=1 Tax=Naganishia cerealis TaxID=610337 RepID=A0ACC2VFC4_9TREE|nr:hypothetical protein QFC19_006498 [Naganishia cerealis]